MKKIFNIKDINRKVLSLVIGLFIWSFIMGIENPEIKHEFRNVEVEIIGTSSLQSNNLHISEPIDPTVNIVVRGVRSNINKLSRKDISATINIEDLEEGSSVVPIELNINSSLGRITLESLEPKNIDVKLEKIITETFPIETEVLGELDEGYSLGEIKPVNKYVRITGPKSSLDKIDRVVAPIELGSDKTDSFVMDTKLLFVDSTGVDIPNIKSNISSTSIEVPIYRLKSIPIDPVIIGDTEGKVDNIKIEPENILIKGYKDVLDEISSIKTKPIKYSDLIGHNDHPLSFDLPEGVSIYQKDQQHVMNYDLKNEQSTSDVYTIDEIEIKNLKEDLDAEIVGADSLDLKPKDKDSKPEVSIDLSDIIEPGNYNIPLDYNRELFDNSNNINIEIVVTEKESQEE